MINSTFEKAYAKLNLSLDVLSRMDDGYHDMKMVFQSISLCDDVEISIHEGTESSISTNLKYLPCDASNIAVKAANAFFKAAGISGYSAGIRLTKRIPVCAGMGGGSSDGAAVLRGLNRCVDYPLSGQDLVAISRGLGSDVPFCVVGGTALGCGRGEVLTELSPRPDCCFVVCTPKFSVSTPELFKRIDCKKIALRPDTDGIIAALNSGDIYGVSRRLYNVFEDVLPRGREDVEEIKFSLLDFGALGAAMTGTGSAVFGIFDSESKAKSAFSVLSKSYHDCFYAKPVNKIQ